MSLFKSLFLSILFFIFIFFPPLMDSCLATYNEQPVYDPTPLSIQILTDYKLSQKEINNDKVIDKNNHFYFWSGNQKELQKFISKNANPKSDLLMVTETSAQRACSQNLTTNIEEGHQAQCSLPAFNDYTVLAWDNNKIRFPANWQDFWNIARYPGKRGLQKDAVSALTIALLADGVPANKVYPILSTPSGVLRAFHKLDQLRPYIVWWSNPNEASLLLRNNRVLMTSASAFTIFRFNQYHHQEHFGIQPKNALENKLSWIVPAHIQAKKIKAIQQFVTHYRSIYADLPIQIDTRSSVNENQLFLQKNAATLEKQFNQWLISPNKP